ncbi:MAG: MgtC/SapB family protein [Oscillospiraceae bacterium]
MASVLSYLRELNIVTMMLRILLAVLCGGLIGLERERKNRPAGFRTYMLTALGATLTVLLSLQLDQMLHGPWRELAESIGATQDVSRFGAEAAKGIGFLGAGTIIITARQQVKGLTTAAGLWASACLGLTIGAGFYACAFICIAYMAACMYLLPPLEQRLTRRAHHINISLEIERMEHLGAIVAHLHDENIRIFDFAVNRNGTGPLASFLCQFSAILPERRDHPELLAELSALEGVILIEEI